MSLPPAKSDWKLEEKHKKALISLLADDDDRVYHTVRETILSYGPASSQWMREHLLSNDPILRRRASEIVNYFARQDADTQFLAFCLNQGEDSDLERGILLLARTQYPSINPEAYSALLDDFAGELRERLDLSAPAGEVLRIINDYLFRELHFSGDDQGFCDPQTLYFNTVLDRRRGNPINLCLLYLLIARRLRLPVAGVGLPGDFLCRYQSSRAEIYIDVFQGGRLMTKGECIKQLLQLQQRFEETSLVPVSARRILLRLCAQLHQIYNQQKAPAQIERLQRYLVALAK